MAASPGARSGADGDLMAAELEALRGSDRYPAHIIASSDRALVRLNLVVSEFRKASVKLVLAAGFPAEGFEASVQASSPTLDESVTSRLAAGASAAANAAAPGGKLEAAAAAAWEVVRDNLLLLAQPEIKRIKKRTKGVAGVQAFKINEKAGSVRIGCKVGKYEGTVVFKVPAAYPDEPVAVSVTKPLDPKTGKPGSRPCSWPSAMLRPFLAKADAMARQAAMGVRVSVLTAAMGPSQIGWEPAATGAEETGTAADRPAGGAPAAAAAAASEAPSAASGAGASAPGAGLRITADVARSFKDDVRFFKEAARVRAFVNETKAGNAKAAAHSGRERKRAVNYLRLMGKKERAKEEAIQESVEAELRAEAEAAMGEALPSDAGQPCLELLWDILGEGCLLGLPLERCPVSRKRLLPADPAALEDILASTSTKKMRLRPIRASCGHMLLWGAMDQAVTRPPFRLACPVCGERMTHSDWTQDVTKLEKAWASKQAKRREIDEVIDFLGAVADSTVEMHSSAGDEDM
ncbi:hypothetical protein FNF29_06519 [Cafeteria roenbergensis]|uniref:Uncharacterized protein n=1 Tax=Cafeteria roenbergensis TaxID=33653 RepID=A0A5A8C7V6_CAFRO|nr:hypothetical protein FNF29_06519 [Cafeteria roenbergensis]|eukprot:KAA0148737.1 hypothetical protein FNF29_06519 [Cafeteria roenbergensis]